VVNGDNFISDEILPENLISLSEVRDTVIKKLSDSHLNQNHSEKVLDWYFTKYDSWVRSKSISDISRLAQTINLLLAKEGEELEVLMKDLNYLVSWEQNQGAKFVEVYEKASKNLESLVSADDRRKLRESYHDGSYEQIRIDLQKEFFENLNNEDRLESIAAKIKFIDALYTGEISRDLNPDKTPHDYKKTFDELANEISDSFSQYIADQDKVFFQSLTSANKVHKLQKILSKDFDQAIDQGDKDLQKVLVAKILYLNGVLREFESGRQHTIANLKEKGIPKGGYVYAIDDNGKIVAGRYRVSSTGKIEIREVYGKKSAWAEIQKVHNPFTLPKPVERIIDDLSKNDQDQIRSWVKTKTIEARRGRIESVLDLAEFIERPQELINRIKGGLPPEDEKVKSQKKADSVKSGFENNYPTPVNGDIWRQASELNLDQLINVLSTNKTKDLREVIKYFKTRLVLYPDLANRFADDPLVVIKDYAELPLIDEISRHEARKNLVKILEAINESKSVPKPLSPEKKKRFEETIERRAILRLLASQAARLAVQQEVISENEANQLLDEVTGAKLRGGQQASFEKKINRDHILILLGIYDSLEDSSVKQHAIEELVKIANWL
jgi:hypothetical protein